MMTQGRFDINEIAFAITVRKTVGTIFTRDSDAAIFASLAAQYGIHFMRLPDGLET